VVGRCGPRRSRLHRRECLWRATSPATADDGRHRRRGMAPTAHRTATAPCRTCRSPSGAARRDHEEQRHDMAAPTLCAETDETASSRCMTSHKGALLCIIYVRMRTVSLVLRMSRWDVCGERPSYTKRGETSSDEPSGQHSRGLRRSQPRVHRADVARSMCRGSSQGRLSSRRARDAVTRRRETASMDSAPPV